MQLGLSLPLASTASALKDQVSLAVAADSLGFDVVWAPEAYGADAVSLLATIAARTQRVGIGSAVLQIPARTPAMTAMTAAGLDALSGGRFRLGLGVSGPQVSEGWHGVRFADPVGRTAEYVGIVRDALARHRVTAAGTHFTLPLADSAGKALSLAFEPERRTVPLYLAAVGPRNLDLVGRLADGWLGIFFDAQDGSAQVAAIRAAAVAAGRDGAAIDTAVHVPLSFGDDLPGAEARLRPYAALYIGGMGSKKVNFYHGIAARMGYEEEADLVQERFLARDYAGAARAVPSEFLQRTCLLGDDAAVAGGLHRLATAGVRSVNVNPVGLPLDGQVSALRALAAVAHREGLAG